MTLRRDHGCLSSAHVKQQARLRRTVGEIRRRRALAVPIRQTAPAIVLLVPAGSAGRNPSPEQTAASARQVLVIRHKSRSAGRCIRRSILAAAMMLALGIALRVEAQTISDLGQASRGPRAETTPAQATNSNSPAANADHQPPEELAGGAAGCADPGNPAGEPRGGGRGQVGSGRCASPEGNSRTG